MDKSLATVSDHGDTALVSFQARDQLYASDVDSMLEFWRLMEQAGIEQKKVVVFRVPSDFFAPSLVDDYWRRVDEAPVSPMPYGARYRPRVAGITDTTMRRSLDFLRDMPAFTIGVVEGEVDFDLLGLLLVCDYHIAVQGTRLLNNSLKRSVPPGTAAPWFLTRLLGYATTRKLYLETKSLTEEEALQLGIFDLVVDAATSNEDCLAAAKNFEQHDPVALKSLTRALGLSGLDLDDYLERNSSGFSTN